MNASKRRRVWKRARSRCEYCRLSQDYEPFFRFHIEHVVARQHHGGDAANNLALACHHCNFHKGTNLSGIDPRSGRIVQIYNPRRQKWSRHFRLSGSRLVGRTSSGRATVALLGMNARHRIELRKEMLKDQQFDAA